MDRRKENRNQEIGRDLEKRDGLREGVERLAQRVCKLRVYKLSYLRASGAGQNQNCLDKA